MNISVKLPLCKEWTVLDDRIIYGKKEIMLKDIKNVKLAVKLSTFSNAVIQIDLENKKMVQLIYDSKHKKEGEEVLKFIQENCGGKEFVKKESARMQSENDKMDRIQSEINNLPTKDMFGTRKEISELKNILSDDESVKAITSGLTDGNTWLIVCTNKRVLMLDKGLIYGLKLIDIPLNRINSISHMKGLLLGKISITDGATTRTIDNVSKETLTFFTETVKEQIELYNTSKNQNINQSHVSNNISPADELLKYKQLLDMGALTQEEFDTKKKELLSI